MYPHVRYIQLSFTEYAHVGYESLKGPERASERKGEMLSDEMFFPNSPDPARFLLSFPVQKSQHPHWEPFPSLLPPLGTIGME